jgi:hypothetical protein
MLAGFAEGGQDSRTIRLGRFTRFKPLQKQIKTHYHPPLRMIIFPAAEYQLSKADRP